MLIALYDWCVACFDAIRALLFGVPDTTVERLDGLVAQLKSGETFAVSGDLIEIATKEDAGRRFLNPANGHIYDDDQAFWYTQVMYDKKLMQDMLSSPYGLPFAKQEKRCSYCNSLLENSSRCQSCGASA